MSDGLDQGEIELAEGIVKVVRGNIWDYKVVVVPVNNSLRADGSAVMGAGLARQAANRYPGLEGELGRWIRVLGRDRLGFFVRQGRLLITFPVKDRWDEPASLDLIASSAQQLCEVSEALSFGLVALPKVGCGNGRLTWTAVEPVLDAELGQGNFVVVDART